MAATWHSKNAGARCGRQNEFSWLATHGRPVALRNFDLVIQNDKEEEMKSLLNTSLKTNNIDLGLLILRTGIGVLMLVHGLPKMASLVSDQPVQFPSVFGLGATIFLGLAVSAEVFCSMLLVLGLGTRLAAILLIITMLVSELHIHGNAPFAKQEMGIHYLLAYIVLLMTGPGRYSVDFALANRLVINQAPVYSRF